MYVILNLKSMTKAGGVTLCNALRAFAINKLLAVFLPPAAFACVGQFLNLMSIGQATSSLALQNGWTSLTAKNKDDEKNLLGIWHGGARLTTFATIFTCIVAILFCAMAPLETLFPGMNPRLVQAAILFAMPGILATNVITIASSALIGLGENGKWAMVNMVASVWQVLWVAFFLYTGCLSVLSIIATQSVVAAFFALRVAGQAGFSLKRIWSTAADIRGPWMSFALMGIVPMILTPVALTIIRTGVDTNFGHDAAGIWQSVWKLSDFIFMIISAVLSVVLLPKVAMAREKSDFSKMFYPMLAFILGLVLLVIAVLYLGRGILVPLLFSKAYIGAVDYMAFQLVGDFFRTGGYALALVLIARSETKSFLIVEACSEVFLTVSSLVLMRFVEFNGPMLAYAIENFLYFVVLFIVVRRLKWNTL